MELELLFLSVALLLVAGEEEGLSSDERRRRDRRTPRIALRKYSKSSFYYLFHSGCDQSLLNCCAVDHKVFQQLLDVFEPIWKLYMPDRNTGAPRKLVFTRTGKLRGRKREIDAVGSLGLLLYWYRTRGSVARATSMAFGLTASPMYRWLKFSRRILLFALQDHPLAAIKDPTEQELNCYVDAIAEKYPILRPERVWAAVDGLKVPIQQSSDWMVQNRFYNGWKAATYINCVFLFAPDGRIRECVYNAPGCWHDSTMADYGVYQKMEELYDLYKVKVVVDSAFKLRNNPFLIRSSQDVFTDEHTERVNRAATSVRQLSEWGMRMIQGQFPRLKDPLLLEECNERKVILNLMMLLYNFQCSTIGHNQILNSFMSKTKGFHSYQHTIDDTANGVFNNG